MIKPLISIIIPIYDVERFLDRCIQSVLKQTYTNIEIILVDDGSHDNCPQMCDKYALNDKRIKVIHKKNGGLSSARNAGLKIATGEWIGFVDSDDWIEPNTYEEAITAALENTVDVVQWNLIPFDDTHEKQIQYLYESGIYKIKELNTMHWILNTAYTKLYAKYLFDEYQFQYPDGVSIIEDICVSYRVFCKISKLYFINKTFYHYYHRTDSILHTIKENEIDKAVFAMNELSDYLRQNKAQCNLIDSLAERKKELKSRYILNLDNPNLSKWRKTFPELNSFYFKTTKMGKVIMFHLDWLAKWKIKYNKKHNK